MASEPITSDDQGFELERGDAIEFAAGKTVRVRRRTLARTTLSREAR